MCISINRLLYDEAMILVRIESNYEIAILNTCKG